MQSKSKRTYALAVGVAAVFFIAVSAYFGSFRSWTVPDTPSPQSLETAANTTTAGSEESTESVAKHSPIRVTGHVFDTSNRPIADALVKFSADPKSRPLATLLSTSMQQANAYVHEARSDATGAYAIEIVHANVIYFAFASKDGYMPEGNDFIVPEEGLKGVDFVLGQAGYLSGRVLDMQRTPVPFVTVMAMRSKDSQEIGGWAESKPSDAEGNFEITQIAPGIEHKIRIRHLPPDAKELYGLGMEIAPEPPLFVTLGAGERREGFEIILPWDPERRVAGTVHNKQGKPIENATVIATFDENQTPRAAPCKSDAEGRFLIKYIEPHMDSVTLRATHIHYESAVIERVPVGSENIDITLLPPDRGDITGVVLDKQTREPIADARVILRAVDLSSGEYWKVHLSLGKDVDIVEQTTTTGSNGEFTLKNSRTGNAKVLIVAEGYGQSIHTIPVTKDSGVPVEILLDAQGTLDVSIRKTGDLSEYPLERIGLLLRPAGDPDARFEMSDGYSEADNQKSQKDMRTACELAEPHLKIALAPGSYDVVATIKSLGTQAEGMMTTRIAAYATAEVVSGSTTTLRIDMGGSGALEGTISTADDDVKCVLTLLPGSDAAVPEGIDLSSPDENGLGGRLTTVTSQKTVYSNHFGSGNFVMPFLQEGTYTLVVTSERKDGTTYVREKRNVTIRAGESVSLDIGD